MKHLTSDRNFVSIIVIALCIIVTLSLVALADTAEEQGPCVGGGSSSDSYTSQENENSVVRKVESGTLHADQNCAGTNENSCKRTYVREATRKEGTETTELWNGTSWVSDGEPAKVILEKGKYVC